MKVYFVRHGESNQNITNQYQSHSDPLSPEGQKQAKAVASRFASIPVDIILSSDLKRTHQTAQAIAAVTGKNVETMELLRERKRPSEFEGLHYHEPKVLEIKDLTIKNRDNPNWRYSDEETPNELIQRAKQFVTLLESRKEESIVVVSHNAFIKFVVASMMFEEDVTPSLVDHLYYFFVTSNTGLTVCKREMDKDKRRIKWHLITWNDQAHLGE